MLYVLYFSCECGAPRASGIRVVPQFETPRVLEVAELAG